MSPGCDRKRKIDNNLNINLVISNNGQTTFLIISFFFLLFSSLELKPFAQKVLLLLNRSYTTKRRLDLFSKLCTPTCP